VDGVTLRGTVSPGVSGRMHLQLDTGDVRLIAELRSGEFAFDPMGHGVVRLHVVTAGQPDVYTDWFRV
jgi:hypothetical protein